MINFNFMDHVFEIAKLNSLTKTPRQGNGPKQELKPNLSPYCFHYLFHTSGVMLLNISCTHTIKIISTYVKWHSFT